MADEVNEVTCIVSLFTCSLHVFLLIISDDDNPCWWLVSVTSSCRYITAQAGVHPVSSGPVPVNECDTCVSHIVPVTRQGNSDMMLYCVLNWP